MGYSASASSAATAGNKVGPVTFGGVNFGNQAASSNTWLYVAIAAAVAVAGFFAFRK